MRAFTLRSWATILVATFLLSTNPCCAEQASNVDQPTIVWVDSDPNSTATVFQRLDSSLSSGGFEFEDTPLIEVVTYLSEEYQIEVQIDRIGLNELGISEEETINNVHLHEIKLGPALRIMLQQLELDYSVRDGVLLITTQEQAESQLSVAAYTIGSFAKGRHYDFDSLINAIQSAIEPDSWASDGSGEGTISLLPQHSVMVVSQTTRGHEQIASLLQALRKVSLIPGHAGMPPARGGYGGEYGGEFGGEEGYGGGGGGFGFGGGFSGGYGATKKDKALGGGRARER
jgi:hypothetical protein